MKKQLLNERVLNLKILFVILLAGVFFSLIKPENSSAQTVITGQLFTWKPTNNWQDTTGLEGANVYVKFYRLNGSNQLIFEAQAPVNSEGFYKVTVFTTADLYAIIPRNDDNEDNFVSTFYPGWLDFESAEPINEGSNGQDTVDVDWGAVGKEIVERPSNGAILSTITGIVETSNKNLKSDIISNVYLFDTEGSLVKTAPIAADGRYNISFYGNGNYEVFTSVPGFASESKFITASTNAKGDYTVNFNLDTYKGESETKLTNVVADKFNLTQNYPNPFNPTTNISFTVNTTGIVKLTVYNSLGKEVTKLVNDLVEPGTYDVTFNGQNLASGIYYYTLQVGNNVITKKMNLIK